MNINIEELYGPEPLVYSKDYTYRISLLNIGVIRLLKGDQYSRFYELNVEYEYDTFKTGEYNEKILLYKKIPGVLRMIDIKDGRLKSYALSYEPRLDLDLLLKLREAEKELIEKGKLNFEKIRISGAKI